MDGMEQALKARYATFRTRGEWFEFSEEALALWPDFLPEAPQQPQPLRLVRPQPSVQERILKLLETHKVFTVRTLQKHLYRCPSGAIKEALRSLEQEGKVSPSRQGKAIVYRCTEVA